MNRERNRAWRRFNARVKSKRVRNSGQRREMPEKNWKLLYLRSEKLVRAKNSDWIIRERPYARFSITSSPVENNVFVMTNLLFICSRNQWRSPTAEAVWRKRPGMSARSAGTSPRARRTVGLADIRWADVIFVMEPKHRNRLVAEYSRALEHKPIHVLEIPDEYRYMDPELVGMLEDSVSACLGL